MLNILGSDLILERSLPFHSKFTGSYFPNASPIDLLLYKRKTFGLSQNVKSCQTISYQLYKEYFYNQKGKPFDRITGNTFELSGSPENNRPQKAYHYCSFGTNSVSFIEQASGVHKFQNRRLYLFKKQDFDFRWCGYEYFIHNQIKTNFDQLDLVRSGKGVLIGVNQGKLIRLNEQSRFRDKSMSNLDSTYHYEYENNLVKQIKLDNNSLYLFEYDSEKNLSCLIRTILGNNTTFKFKYNSDSFCHKILQKSEGDNKIEYTYEVKPHEDSENVYMIREIIKDQNNNRIGTYKYYYNIHGDLYRISSSKGTLFSNQYTYDEKGNWVTCLHTNRDAYNPYNDSLYTSSYKLEREIEYIPHKKTS